MTKYAILYYGEPSFSSREEGAAYQAKWRAWAGNLGSALIEPAIPLGAPQAVGPDGAPLVTSGPDRLSGFSVVEAESMDRALALAQGCPHLEHGRLVVSEILDMGM